MSRSSATPSTTAASPDSTDAADPQRERVAADGHHAQPLQAPPALHRRRGLTSAAGDRRRAGAQPAFSGTFARQPRVKGAAVGALAVKRRCRRTRCRLAARNYWASVRHTEPGAHLLGWRRRYWQSHLASNATAPLWIGGDLAALLRFVRCGSREVDGADSCSSADARVEDLGCASPPRGRALSAVRRRLPVGLHLRGDAHTLA